MASQQGIIQGLQAGDFVCVKDGSLDISRTRQVGILNQQAGQNFLSSYRKQPPKTFRDELQDEVDKWLNSSDE